MCATRRTERGDLVLFALAGLETGVLAGLFVLGWYALSSSIAGQPVWAVSLRLAVAVYGRGVLGHGPAAAALTGAALDLASAGLVGILFGLAIRSPWLLRRVVLLGLLFGLGWHYVGYGILLRKLGAAPYAIASRWSLLVAHVLFGLLLAMYPRFLNSLGAGPREGR